jgi:hypothetical protein
MSLKREMNRSVREGEEARIEGLEVVMGAVLVVEGEEEGELDLKRKFFALLPTKLFEVVRDSFLRH